MTTPIATADCDGNVTINTDGVPIWGNGPVTTASYTLNGTVIALPYHFKPGLDVTSAVFTGIYSGTVDGVPVSGEVAYPVSWQYPTDCVAETTTTAPVTTVPATTTTIVETTTTRPGETTTTHTNTTTPTTPPGTLPPTGGNAAPVAGAAVAIALGAAAVLAGTRRRLAR